MKRAVLLLLALAGCSDQNKLWRESEIHDIAEDASADAVAGLESRIAELEQRTEAQGEYIDAVSRGTTAALNSGLSLSKQIEQNAAVANENAVKDMTRRAACGRRPKTYYNDDGSVRYYGLENIPCTINDLNK